MKSRRLIFDVVIKPVVFIKAAQLVFFMEINPSQLLY